MHVNENVEKKHYVYVGTYTQNGGKGIYIYRLDSSTGKLDFIEASSLISNPSYLAVSNDGKFLYAVSENESAAGVDTEADLEADTGAGARPDTGADARPDTGIDTGVASFSIDKFTGKIMFLNSAGTKGSAACHLSTDRSGRYLFAANYGDGSLIAFNLNKDGSIGTAASHIRHHGSGPDPVRQERPHVHYAALSPDEKYLFTADLGIDRIVVYGPDPVRQGSLLHEVLSVPVKPGSGPRHIEFSSDGKFVWLLNELSSDIAVYSFDASKPALEQIQSISALPEGFTGKNYSAAIHRSPDSNYLYASNREHDSIAAFRIDKSTGLLGKPFFTWSGGSWPRDFAITPDGRFLFAANQHSGTIVPFAVDRDTGMPRQLDWQIEVPDPTCVIITAV